MKKAYVKPVMESEEFVANEYVAACWTGDCRETHYLGTMDVTELVHVFNDINETTIKQDVKPETQEYSTNSIVFVEWVQYKHVYEYIRDTSNAS